MNLPALIERFLRAPTTTHPVRFTDICAIVRRVHPDADVCEIDLATRRFATGEPGEYVYQADRQRVLPGMEE